MLKMVYVDKNTQYLSYPGRIVSRAFHLHEIMNGEISISVEGVKTEFIWCGLTP